MVLNLNLNFFSKKRLWYYFIYLVINILIFLIIIFPNHHITFACRNPQHPSSLEVFEYKTKKNVLSYSISIGGGGEGRERGPFIGGFG
jgi:hypothetical protein